MTFSSEFVKQKAIEVGFDLCGIAPAGLLPQMEAGLRDWLSKGRHAAMHYMEEHKEMRSDPRQLVEGARSVICLAAGYKPDRTMKGTAKIAQYTYGQDYHETLKAMLFALMAAIKEEYPDFEAKPCVDTVPISDKLWAERSGLGWIGKNTLLVTPTMGSYVNLAELVTPSESDIYDDPMENRCGDCHRCLDACPNHALDGVSLDARLCNSYNTIENRAEDMPDNLDLRGYAYGCDCCQLVCPYNIEAEPRIHVSEELLNELETLVDSDEKTFRHFTKHRAMNRIKYGQWQRNIKKSNSDDQNH